MATVTDYLEALQRDKNNYRNIVANTVNYTPSSSLTFTEITNNYINRYLPKIAVDPYYGISMKGYSYHHPTDETGYWVIPMTTSISPVNIVEDTRALAHINFTHTSLEYVFRNASLLTNLDVSDWKVNNAVSAAMMFNGCSLLSNLDLGKWNTNNFFNIAGMFDGCYSLTNANIGKWNIHNVKNMAYTFSGSHYNLFTLSGWNTHNVTTLWDAFAGSNITNTNFINGWNLHNVIDMTYAFARCQNLTYINLHRCNLNNLSSFGSLCEDCYNLTTASGFNYLSTPNLRNIGYMFKDCNNLTSINLSFQNCYNLNGIFYGPFNGCNKLTTVYLKNIGFSLDEDGDRRQVQSAFSFLPNLTYVNAYGWNLTNVYSLSFMFQYSNNLQTVILNGWNLHNVETVECMFRYCNNLSNSSLQNIATAMLTATNLPVKNLSNTNGSSPLWATNKQINSATVGSDLINRLTAAGWTF